MESNHIKERQWDADSLYLFWEDIISDSKASILSRDNKTPEVLVYALIGIYRELEKLNGKGE